MQWNAIGLALGFAAQSHAVAKGPGAARADTVGRKDEPCAGPFHRLAARY